LFRRSRMCVSEARGHGNSFASQFRQRGGFSLVEILVCIVIIAIVAALCLTGYRSMIENGNRAKCMNNLRQVGVALNLYAADHDGKYPNAFIGTVPAPTTAYWIHQVAGYAGLKDGQAIGLDALRCPTKTKEAKPYNVSLYGVNYPLIMALDPGQAGSSWLEIGSKRVANNVNKSAFLVADAVSATVFSPLSWPLTKDSDGDGFNDSNASFKYNRVDFRHDNKANFYRLDGSVVSLTPLQWAKNHENIWGAPK
jgi:prepilin-type N-terminal cleavage/methylation domain-containing protein/prepilin-type processing-associated H-X9-DG protein